jgi:hypothetical protein
MEGNSTHYILCVWMGWWLIGRHHEQGTPTAVGETMLFNEFKTCTQF